ncbi:MAG: hypothetical protein HY823_06590 [Acidobacteria bacterium]|nr:hypothetical protein [Acidobacteriota bacterium]
MVPGLLAAALLAGEGCGTGSHRPPPPAFSLALEPGTARLLPGLSLLVMLDLAADPGFSGEVELSLPEPAADLAGSFSPARLQLSPGTAGHATLLLKASPEAAPGPRLLTLRASCGLLVREAVLKLDLPQVPFFTVRTYNGFQQENFPLLLYQDGGGPWIPVEGDQGLYKLPVSDPGGRFGVLFGMACPQGPDTGVLVNGFFETLAETQSLQAYFFCTLPPPGPPPETFDLSGSLAGAETQTVLLSGNSGLWRLEPGAANYKIPLVKGLGDLVAGAYPSPENFIPSRLVVERRRNTQGNSRRDFDFSSQGLPTPVRESIPRPLLDPLELFHGTVQVQTGGGQTAFLGYGPDLESYAVFPEALAEEGDTHAYAFQATGPGWGRGVTGYRSSPPGRLLPGLPPVIPEFQVETFGESHRRFGVRWQSVLAGLSVSELTLFQRVGQGYVYWYTHFSKGWTGSQDFPAFSQPDLTPMARLSGYQFRPGLPVDLTLSQYGGADLQGAAFPVPFPRSGDPLPRMPRSLFTPPDLPTGSVFRIRRAAPPPPPWAAAAGGGREYTQSWRTRNLIP